MLFSWSKSLYVYASENTHTHTIQLLTTTTHSLFQVEMILINISDIWHKLIKLVKLIS